MKKRSGACSMLFCAAAGISMLGTVAAQSPGPGRVIAPAADFIDASALAIQPDDKILVVGRSLCAIGVLRLEPDGRVDTSFASQGIARADFPGCEEQPLAITLQPDGRIVTVGQTKYRGSNFAVARLLPDGRLDESFGAGGMVTTDFTRRQDEAHAFGSDGIVTTDFLGATDSAIGVGVQSDGRIVACGNACTMRSGDECFVAVARYHRDGTLDPTFGVN